MSPSKSPAKIWPPSFTPFPQHDDAQAAQAWFKQPGNMRFTAWEGAVGERSQDWEGLEQAVCTITGVELGTLRICGKNAVEEILEHSDRHKRCTTEQKKGIGKRAGSLLQERMQDQEMPRRWAAVSTEWLVTAGRTLAPRFIHLWKKRAREQNHQNGRTRSPEAEAEAAGASPRKRARREDDGRASPEPVPAREASSRSRHLCEHRIEVRGTRQRIHVAVDALVQEDARGSKDQDIRSEHLSFANFCRILAPICPHSGNGLQLTYRPSVEPHAKVQVICQEQEFQIAVGLLVSDARQLGEEVLVMQLEGEVEEEEEEEGGGRRLRSGAR